VSSSPTPPPSPPASHYKNLGTMVPGVTFMNAWQMQAKKKALSFSDAYAIAVAADRTRPPQTEVGYRLYWMNDHLLGSRDVVAHPSSYAVVGRHGSCDVVLDDERLVSLRHVIVRTASLDDGCPVVSVLDLQTTAGFELSDESRQRSIAASGPVVFRIGTHSLVALPSSGRFPEKLPVPIVERGELAPHRVAAQRIVRKNERDGGPPKSLITLLPNTIDFSQRRSSVPIEPFSVRSPDFVPTGEGYEVMLEREGRLAGVRLSKTDLEHGVLIGRADKCVDEGLRSILVDCVSRVHVLLIREKGACHLYDSGSLVGTFSGGQRVRCLPLADSGTTAQLAKHYGVTLHWRAI
jgi:pSer/pThr/pTyr-binding forkhead associated (FHA) protein